VKVLDVSQVAASTDEKQEKANSKVWAGFRILNMDSPWRV